MQTKYLVHDTRTNDNFKKSTFSGYKKADVLTEFTKACSDNKLENALFWLVEIHCSMYMTDFFEKIFIFISTKIHLNSYNLPSIVWNHYLFWMDQEKKGIPSINNQKIRNSLFEVTALLIQCERHRVIPKKKVIKDHDFNINKLSSMITCSTNHISPNIIKTKDPKVLTIVFNELSYCITQHSDLQGKIQDKKEREREHYMDKAVYWLSWIHKWESVQKKKGGSPDCAQREVTNITKEDSCDIVWICWAVILAECRRRHGCTSISQVASLYNMYKVNFTRSKKAGRMAIIVNALALLILDDAQVSLTNLTNPLIIQAIMKCNLLYQNIKKFEVRVQLPPPNLMQVNPVIKEGKVKKKGKDKMSDKVKASVDKFDLVMEIDMQRQNI